MHSQFKRQVLDKAKSSARPKPPNPPLQSKIQNLKSKIG